jgi:hypothetical protein
LLTSASSVVSFATVIALALLARPAYCYCYHYFYAMAPSPPTSPSAETPPSPTASPRESSRPNLLSTLGEVLTADLDDSKFHFLHPRRIPWIQNPLDSEDESSGGESGKEGDAELAPEVSREVQPVPKVVQAVEKKDGGEHHHLHFGPNPFELAPDEPPLRFQTESSTIQLFYDLFFVANLTTFTAKHDVTDGSGESRGFAIDLSDSFRLEVVRRLLRPPVVHLAAGRALRHPLRARLGV